jgi:hypothetical protein
MAETTDRPPEPPDAAASARPADERVAPPHVAAVSAALPAAPPPSGDEPPKPYSSLSVLAIVGFALAVCYAVVMVLGELIALLNHAPLILPLWTFVFPLAAAGVCWAARSRVRNSEGALTGARLAAWGAGLSLAVGVVYAAYYAGTYFAVTSQAAAAADRWMNFLKNDQLDKAFLMIQPPPRPADDTNLRDRLELEYDRGPQGGDLTRFRQLQLVRQLEQGGPADKVQLLGVQKWGYEGGGFQADLSYRVSTPCMTSDVAFTVVGTENPDDSGERQWTIKAPHLTNSPTLTEEGERMMAMAPRAEAFGQQWLAEVAAWKWDDAYLGTLPPEERQLRARERGPDFDKAVEAFRAGGVVRFDPQTFWAGPHEKDPEKERQRQDKAADVVRSIFGHGGESPERLDIAPSQLPVYHREGDRVRLGFDFAIPLKNQLVLARLYLATDGRDPGTQDWRVDSLELISAKSAGGPPGAGQRPGAPPGGGPPGP